MKLNFFEYFNNSLITDSVPHAFLIETNDVETTFTEIVDFLYKKKLLKKDNYLNNLNFILIQPEGKEIKKEGILYLQDRYSKLPVNDPYNIYVIKNAELLNKSSTNTLLKFLEEPSSKIIGILLIDNGTIIAETIFSRCQHFIIKNTGSISANNDVNEFIDVITQDKSFIDLTNLKNKYKTYERKDLIYLFKEVLKKLEKKLSKKEKMKIGVSENIILIDKILRMLESNVNIDLVLDKFLIELR